MQFVESFLLTIPLVVGAWCLFLRESDQQVCFFGRGGGGVLGLKLSCWLFTPWRVFFILPTGALFFFVKGECLATFPIC